MSKEHELEKAESWDLEHPEVKGPAKASRRVIVSIAFRHDDFMSVSERAKLLNKKISEFIREAAIEKASGRGMGVLSHSTNSTVTNWWANQNLIITS